MDHRGFLLERCSELPGVVGDEDGCLGYGLETGFHELSEVFEVFQNPFILATLGVELGKPGGHIAEHQNGGHFALGGGWWLVEQGVHMDLFEGYPRIVGDSSPFLEVWVTLELFCDNGFH